MNSFDAKINTENLTKCLQTLKQFYGDLLKDKVKVGMSVPSAFRKKTKKKQKKRRRKKGENRTNHLDATRERQVIPLNSEEDTFFLSVILSLAYSTLYCESDPNKMARLASILSKGEQ